MNNQPLDNTDHKKNLNIDEDNDLINLKELLGTLIDERWLLLIIILISLLLGIGIIIINDRIFRVDAMLQVQEKSKPITGLDSLSEMYGTKLPLMAEIEIIKSRKVLGAAIDDLNLEVIAKPFFLPYLGEVIVKLCAYLNLDNTVFNSFFFLKNYSWGKESIEVDTLVVPDELREKQFILLAGYQNQYQLFFEDELIAEGEVGKLISIQIENYQQPISISLSLLKAQPGQKFILKRRSSISTIEELRKLLFVSEKGKNSGIIELAMESNDAANAVEIINKISEIYIRQNVDLKSAESRKTLEFIEKQFPILKAELNSATSALNNYKNQQDSVNLDIETHNMLTEIIKIKTQITLLQQDRDELRQRFTESHPNVIVIDKQIERLQSQLKTYNQTIKALPKKQQEIMELTGNVQVNTNLYNRLLDNMQTLRMTKEGTVADARVIDYAIQPNQAIKPNKPIIILVAFILGLSMGIVVVIVRKSMFQGIDDPDMLEKQFNIPVYATIFHSENQDMISKELTVTSNSIGQKRQYLLSILNKDDIAIESLRSFRTSLYFSLLGAQSNIIVITGPSPNVGKSFISSNLSVLIADIGKKILLIDADMRRGNLNQLFGLNRSNGLSDLILNTCSIQDATKTVNTNVDFIPTGTFFNNPSELLLSNNFTQLIDKLKKEYDLVIVDTPPILAVTDAAIIAQHAGSVLMVIKAKSHNKREIEQSIKKFNQAGTKVNGFILNDLSQYFSQYGYRYSYGKYVYQYQYHKDKLL